MTSIGLRPAGLFFSLTGVNTAVSISARKLSNGTTRAIISSGSPFAVIAASRLSASKNPNCPIVPTRESCCHNSDSHKSAEVAIFRGPLQAVVSPCPAVYDMISPVAARLYDPLSPIETAESVVLRCHLPELYSLKSGDHGLPLITGQCPCDAARYMPRIVAAGAIQDHCFEAVVVTAPKNSHRDRIVKRAEP